MTLPLKVSYSGHVEFTKEMLKTEILSFILKELDRLKGRNL